MAADDASLDDADVWCSCDHIHVGRAQSNAFANGWVKAEPERLPKARIGIVRKLGRASTILLNLGNRVRKTHTP